MKRIYLLMILVVISGAAFAQGANLDLKTRIGSWQGTNKLLITENSSTDNPVPDTLFWTVKNLGPANLMIGDTLHFYAYRISKGYYYVVDAKNSMEKDSTRTFRVTTNITPGASAVSENKTIQWCDSVWVTRGTAVVPDPDVNNNKICNNVAATYWANSINSVDISSNVLTVFPNPAHGSFKVKFDFGSNATGNIVVRDILGKVVYQQNLGKNLSGEKEYAVDASNFSAGLYFVELTANETKKVAKVTLQ